MIADDLAKQNVTHDSSNPYNQLISNLIQTQLATAGLTANVQSYPTAQIYECIGGDGGLNYLGCSAPPVTAALVRGLENGDAQAFSEAAAATDVDDFVVPQPWLKGVEQAHLVTNPNALRLAALSVG